MADAAPVLVIGDTSIPDGFVHRFATALREEIAITHDVRNKDAYYQHVFTELPPRSTMKFQQVKGQDAPKAAAADDLRAEVKVKLGHKEGVKEQHSWHCLGHKGQVLSGAAASDHFHAYDDIENNLMDLLEFLNANPKFTSELLKQPDMNKLFGYPDTQKGALKGAKNKFYKLESSPDQGSQAKSKPGTKGKAKADVPPQLCATEWLIKSLYNTDENLWVLCQACNSIKSNKGSEKWLAETLDDGLMQAIKEQGGIVKGILVDSVAKKGAKNESCKLKINDNREKAFDLPSSRGTGLGRFTHDYLKEQPDNNPEVSEKAFEAYLDIFKAVSDQLFDIRRDGTLTNEEKSQLFEDEKVRCITEIQRRTIDFKRQITLPPAVNIPRELRESSPGDALRRADEDEAFRCSQLKEAINKHLDYNRMLTAKAFFSKPESIEIRNRIGLGHWNKILEIIKDHTPDPSEGRPKVVNPKAEEAILTSLKLLYNKHQTDMDKDEGFDSVLAKFTNTAKRNREQQQLESGELLTREWADDTMSGRGSLGESAVAAAVDVGTDSKRVKTASETGPDLPGQAGEKNSRGDQASGEDQEQSLDSGKRS